ncbi:hypothetical protein PR048_030297 [Dryococelus australis]|uniref:Uncharacterized protein n=1 Tax=Dryococelus australis TaxID=614101 RepID=A0ABQ9G9D0_9NEOP|nr:hypothetical protein PR048_030297 [Dryococelus australis]
MCCSGRGWGWGVGEVDDMHKRTIQKGFGARSTTEEGHTRNKGVARKFYKTDLVSNPERLSERYAIVVSANAQQASWDVQLCRRHMEKDAFRCSALPSYRRRIRQPGLIPWLVERMPAYRGVWQCESRSRQLAVLIIARPTSASPRQRRKFYHRTDNFTEVEWRSGVAFMWVCPFAVWLLETLEHGPYVWLATTCCERLPGWLHCWLASTLPDADWRMAFRHATGVGEIWAALNIEVLRANKGEARRVWRYARMQGRGKREIPGKPADQRHRAGGSCWWRGRGYVAFSLELSLAAAAQNLHFSLTTILALDTSLSAYIPLTFPLDRNCRERWIILASFCSFASKSYCAPEVSLDTPELMVGTTVPSNSYGAVPAVTRLLRMGCPAVVLPSTPSAVTPTSLPASTDSSTVQSFQIGVVPSTSSAATPTSLPASTASSTVQSFQIGVVSSTSSAVTPRKFLMDPSIFSADVGGRDDFPADGGTAGWEDRPGRGGGLWLRQPVLEVTSITNESEEGIQVPLSDVVRGVSAAIVVPPAVVYRINQEVGFKDGTLKSFSNPHKRRAKRQMKTNIDDFDIQIVRWTINNSHVIDKCRPIVGAAGGQDNCKRVYTEVTFAIGSELVMLALDGSEPIADLQGNKTQIPHCQLPLEAAVVWWSDYSPPTKANRARSPAGSPDFRTWESCRMMPLVGGDFSGISRFPRHFSSGATPCSLQSPSSFSQHLAVKRR